MNSQVFGSALISLDVRDVKLYGPLDVFTDLHRWVEEQARITATLVLVNVEGLTGVNPSGVADLVQSTRAARANGGDLRLYGCSPLLVDALSALALTSVLRVYADRSDAIGPGGVLEPLTYRPRLRLRRGRRSRSVGVS